jgi:IS4 transposase
VAGRLVKQGTSWIAPWDVRRVKADSNDNQTAVEQVKALDKQSKRLKVVVADSLYANVVFLAVFKAAKTVFGLVRLRRNLNLYEQPETKQAGSRGAPRKHGPKFKTKNPSRSPDRTQTFFLGLQEIRLSAWHELHFRKLPGLVGLALQVEFLKPDGSLRYLRPMWLFWTGPETIALSDLCRMYLWRFAIEHAFRFMNQHLGLTAHYLTNNDVIQRWMWLCALAYWQLLLMGRDVDDLSPAWYPS